MIVFRLSPQRSQGSRVMATFWGNTIMSFESSAQFSIRLSLTDLSQINGSRWDRCSSRLHRLDRERGRDGIKDEQWHESGSQPVVSPQETHVESQLNLYQIQSVCVDVQLGRQMDSRDYLSMKGPSCQTIKQRVTQMLKFQCKVIWARVQSTAACFGYYAKCI